MSGLVYLGTSTFAASVLRRLVAAGRRPELVVTRPDARRGRGRRMSPPPVAALARELGLALIQPDDVNTEQVAATVAAAAGEDGDVALCAFGALIGRPLLEAHEIVNVHPSLLPRWRGAAPIERAIIAGDRETGVSIMAVCAELDAGPVFATRSEPILPDDDYGSLAGRLEAVAAELLDSVLAERPAPVTQAHDGVTYAEKIGPDDRTIDPSDPARAERVVRALRPHIGARVALPGGGHLGVVDARVRDGALELMTVRPAGGRDMSYEDYVRGHGPVPDVA